ncbi:hypothetical protein V5O48_011414 [Marasmius crinis-equi]|uniref:Sulfhydryl oxidase n=1 Tax=Marasmius crinis-equi TaxID=585013 RepID=A0ABR3F5P7_9AGAR
MAESQTKDEQPKPTGSGYKTLPSGVVLGPDGKPCKPCTAFRNWRKQAAGTEGTSKPSTTALMSSLAFGTPSNTASSDVKPPAHCPPDVEQLGTATWTFLHTTAAYYPERPTPNQRANMLSLIRALPILYPCSHCANDFGEDLKVHPPDVSGRAGLSRWLCERHNEVNLKLGKKQFDCGLEKLDERWKDGPSDDAQELFFSHPRIVYKSIDPPKDPPARTLSKPVHFRIEKQRRDADTAVYSAVSLCCQFSQTTPIMIRSSVMSICGYVENLRSSSYYMSHALPFEVLFEIFNLCRLSGEDDPEVPHLLNIASVCKQWRSVSLADPRLWSFIAIEGERKSNVHLVRQWIERSQSSPLTIILRYITTQAAKEILPLLLEHLPRWKTFNLSYATTSEEEVPYSPFPINALPDSPAAPILEQVAILNDMPIPEDTSRPFNPWPVAFQSPALRRVSWTCNDCNRCEGYCHCAHPMMNVNINIFERLTHISSPFSFDSGFLDMLSHCHGLEVLDIPELRHEYTFGGQDTFTMLSDGLVTLPRLRTLKVSSACHGITALCDRLILPAMDELALQALRGRSKFPLRSVTALLDRSSSNLRALNLLVSYTANDADILKLLANPALKSVEELEIRKMSRVDKIAEGLRCNPGEPALLPCLQKLTLEAQESEDGLLSQMVDTRKESLKKVSLSLNPSQALRSSENMDWQFFEELLKTGFDVFYFYAWRILSHKALSMRVM